MASRHGVTYPPGLTCYPSARSVQTYTFYFGPNAPVGKESMWVKTIPGKGWWSVLRIYGPEADSFNGNWIPGDIVEIEMK